jgi:hypothetical protein
MNTNVLIRAAWQSLISAIIAGIIYLVIYASINKGSVFILGTLLVAGCTFVIAFILTLIFSMLFGRKQQQ